MLRRVARVLRVLLVVLAVVLLLWLPVSWFYRLSVFSPWPFDQTCLIVQDLVVHLRIDRKAAVRPDDLTVRIQPITARSYDAWPPTFQSTRLPDWVGDEVVFPIWLLALLLLAWPVTSFIVARRKRQRGFAVEAAGARETVNEEC